MELHSEYPEIVAELEAMRPRPRPDFAAELDACVAAGFSDSTRQDASWFDRLGERLSGLSWRRVAVPVGAAALIAIAVATAVISISESGPAAGERRITDQPVASPEVAPRPAPSDSAANLNEFSQKVPQVVGSSGTGSAAGAGATESGPYAARARVRDIERSARVTLAVDPDDVRSAASDVFTTVHSYEGIVLRSSVRTRGRGDAVASFDLLIPRARLDDALAAFSDIGPVSSRSDASVDVTAPTIGLEERAQDSKAKIESLLRELSGAESDTERESVEAELRSERNRLARVRSSLNSLQRRTHFSRVSLRIESDPDSAGSWGAGDALDDAEGILGIAAGVTLIGLAVLAPIALIALLGWAAQRAWVRRSRERVLD
jgi:hypothetical protein